VRQSRSEESKELRGLGGDDELGRERAQFGSATRKWAIELDLKEAESTLQNGQPFWPLNFCGNRELSLATPDDNDAVRAARRPPVCVMHVATS
jgi:hypothetical protein